MRKIYFTTLLLITACTASTLGQKESNDMKSNIVGHWSFDEGTGVQTKDLTENKNHGVLKGATWVAEGKSGSALSFDGVDDQVDMPRSSIYAFKSTDSFTVDFWIKTQQTSFCTVIMARLWPGGEVSYSFVLGRERRKISFETWSWASVKLISKTSVADNKWHHISGVYDGGSNQGLLFVDGKIESSGSMGQGGVSETELRIGNNIRAHQPFKGMVDELKISRSVSKDALAAIEKWKRWRILTDQKAKTEMFGAYMARMTVPSCEWAKTKEEWYARREFVRRKVLDTLGLWPLPDRVPLQPHISGTLERDGYRVKRIYWQTWPNVYASGYLYLPERVHSPLPAILCPHGHWRDGAKNSTVQSRCIALAKKGYVAMAVDSVHVNNWSIGVCPVGVMTWNNIRAVDYLMTRPEVDKERIGCTGASGGGQQTMYMMAVDDRIKASAPVCLISYFSRILSHTFAHCHCNHVPGIMAYTDEPEMCALFAPRPALYICVTGDWTKWFPKEGYPEIKKIYDIFGATEKVDCVQYDCGHDYNKEMRERVYTWFNKWLKGIDDPQAAIEPELKTETIETLGRLDGSPKGSQGFNTIAEEYTQRRRFELPELETDSEWRGYASLLREKLSSLVGESRAKDAALSGKVVAREEKKSYIVEKITFTSEQEITVPGVLLIPKPALSNANVKADSKERNYQAPAMIVVHPEGKADLLTNEFGFVQKLLGGGVIVFVVDPRFYGDLAANRHVWEMNGLILGRSEAGMAAHDIIRAGDYLRTRSEIAPKRIACIGFGEASIAVLLAAALDERIESAVCEDIGVTYSAGRTRPVIGNVLTLGDLPQIASLIAPRLLFITGMKSWTEAEIDFLKRGYDVLGAPERLKMRAESGRAYTEAMLKALRKN